MPELTQPRSESCAVPKDSDLWAVASVVCVRELLRGGRDPAPQFEAERLISAMRQTGHLFGYRRVVDAAGNVHPCVPAWDDLACLCYWYSQLAPEARQHVIFNIAAGKQPWGDPSVPSPLAQCPGGQAGPWCCPTGVRYDPIYGRSQEELYAAAKRQPPGSAVPAAVKPPMNIAAWIIAIAAAGSFAITLASYLSRMLSEKKVAA